MKTDATTNGLRAIPASLQRCACAVLASAAVLAAPVEAGGYELHRIPPTQPPSRLELRTTAEAEYTIVNDICRVILINFWASWCPPCLAEIPSLLRLRQAMAGRPFALVLVNAGEPAAAVERTLRRLDPGLASLLDEDSRENALWTVRVYPTSYLLDRAGRVRTVVIGSLEWDSSEGVALVRELLDEPADGQALATCPEH